MALKEYKPGTAFTGVIGRTLMYHSRPGPSPRAKEGAPNVLFIVQDDTGFGQMGCYGSPIETPNIDNLAKNGLLFNNMHTTALCSPTRSCILTGRNHHSNAMACITEGSTGYPGSNGYIPFENGFLSEILLQHGYNTYALGKWHLTPATEFTGAGPYDRWPLGRGFERFYGFLGADTHQYYPDLTYDNHSVEPPKTPEEGYHLTEDITDKAISFIADSKQNAPNKPFFMYFCPGAGHAPHHVPKEWADKYKGKFDMGWDKYREMVFERQKKLGIIPPDAELSRHDPDVQAVGPMLAGGEEGLRPHDGGVRGLPLPHGLSLRPPVRVPERDRRVGQHADHVHLRQRRQRRGRPDRLGQREPVLQLRARDPGREPEGPRRPRRAEVLQPLPLGLDLGRQHALPPLEARDLSRRHQRPVHRPLAQGHQGQGGGPHASTPTPSTWCRPCSSSWGSRRRPASGASPSRRSRA